MLSVRQRRVAAPTGPVRTHPDLRRAPRGRAGVKDADLVGPTPTPEQGVSDHGLKEQSGVILPQEDAALPQAPPPTQDSSSTMKLAAGVSCISPTVLHPYPPK